MGEQRRGRMRCVYAYWTPFLSTVIQSTRITKQVASTLFCQRDRRSHETTNPTIHTYMQTSIHTNIHRPFTHRPTDVRTEAHAWIYVGGDASMFSRGM